MHGRDPQACVRGAGRGRGALLLERVVILESEIQARLAKHSQSPKIIRLIIAIQTQIRCRHAERAFYFLNQKPAVILFQSFLRRDIAQEYFRKQLALQKSTIVFQNIIRCCLIRDQYPGSSRFFLQPILFELSHLKSLPVLLQSNFFSSWMPL